MRRTLSRASLLAAASLGAGAGALAALQEPAPSPSPLFASSEPLELTLAADFEALDGDRSQESEERPGVVTLRGAGGEEVALEVQVRTRGNRRLERRVCHFPPLRLNFKKGQLEGTVLDGEDKLKLVTHCRDRDDYEQNVLEEHAIYKAYNLVTDASFGVRLVRMTYVDVNGEDQPVTRWGFLIEDDEALAARLGGTLMEVAQAPPWDVDGPSSARMAVFQYMVGNTDWSAVYMHNTKLVRLPDGSYVSVPYDFDYAGVVDAPYAVPSQEIGTRNVRQRVFRGYCRDDVTFSSFYPFFLERKEAFLDVFRTQPGLEEDNVRRAVEYLEEFFGVIGSERRAEREIARACRSMETGRVRGAGGGP